MPNDDFPLDQFQRIAMTLSEILANRPQNRALARASDVPGADLQWMYTTAYPTGAWFGNLGELGTTVFRDGLFTGYLATGARATVNGQQISWRGAGVGWGEEITQRIKRLAANAAYPVAAATPPTITVSAANAATQIPDGVTIANNDPRIRYGSDMVIAGDNYPNNLCVIGMSVNYGNWHILPGRHSNRTCPEFCTDSDDIEVSVLGTGECKFTVYYKDQDGPWYSAGNTVGVEADGNFYKIRIKFTSNYPRTIRIEGGFLSKWVDFRISSASMLWAVRPTDIRAIILGDSFTEGGSGIPGVYGPMSNWAARLGWLMGWGDTWLSGVGSTGYTAALDGKLKLTDRIATDIGNYAPDVIVIAAGVNDGEATASEVETGAESSLEKIRAITGAPVFVIGAWNPRSGDPSQINAGIKAAVAKFGGVYYVGDTLLNGTGHRGQPANNGNSDFYVGEDGVHPTLLGHKYLALRAREAILAALG